MTQQRQYESATVFNARIAIMNHLWAPADEFKGKKQDKPSWFAGFIVPKTQAQWFSEPALTGIAQACGKLYTANPHIVSWPIVDGDLPSPETGKQSEWAKGHWLFTASTNNGPPNVEMVQAGGQLVKLTNKVGVKSGDYCMVGVTAAIKQNDPRGVKLFLNAVVFSAPGEEIAIGNSVSGAELMKMAQAQGLQVAGFAGSPGFPQQGGFAPPAVAPAPAPAASAPSFGAGPAFPSSGIGSLPANLFPPR